MTKRKDPSQLRHIKGGDWTPAADEILVSNYGQWHAQNVANKINSRLGTKFTAKAVYDRAERELHISARDCQGLLTLTDAARELGINPTTLKEWLNFRRLETVGKGKYRYLTEATWQMAKDRWPPIPEPTMSTFNAAERLHVCHRVIVNRARAGTLVAYRFGKNWKISVSDIERLERIQRGTSVIGDLSPELGKKRR